MNIRERKEQIRKELLDRRGRMAEEEYHGKSDMIVKRLRQLPELHSAQIVHCYVSMNQRREVNTHPLLKSLIKKGRDVVVPRTNIDSGLLSHIPINGFHDLEPNAWGVLEPPEGNEIDADELDLVIVPMVGGDLNCNRIGYGKGFYDRFLQKASCQKVGLLFETCLVDEIPVEPFDVRLDTLITESRIIN